MKYSICLYFILFVVYPLFAQNKPVHDHVPDSLLNSDYIFDIIIADAERAQELLDIMVERNSESPDSLFALQGDIYHNARHKYILAAHYYEKALKEAKNTNNKDFLPYLYRAFLESTYISGDYNKVISYAIEATEREEVKNDLLTLANAEFKLGMVYLKQGKKEEAMPYINSALERLEKSEHMSSKFYLISFCLTLGESSLSSREEDLAYFQKAEKIVKEVDDSEVIPGGTDYYKKSIYTNLAIALAHLERFDEANVYYNLLLDFDEESPVDFSSNVFYLTTVKRYREAIDMGIKHISLYNEDPSGILDNVYDVYRCMAESYTALGDYKNANACLQKQMELKEQLYNTQNIDRSLEYAAIYENQKKEFIIKEQELKLSQRAIWLISSGIALVLLLIILLLIIRSRNKIQLKNRIMVQQIKELQKQQDLADVELEKRETFHDNREVDDDILPESRKDKLCLAIRDIILKDKIYRNPSINREQVINLLGTSKNIFIEAFQYCFNMSFSEYINHLRLKEALVLLEKSDLSIEEISLRVGFGTIRTFNRQFQAKYNMSPKEYRKLAKEENGSTPL